MPNGLPPVERGPQNQGPEVPLHYDEQALTDMFQAPDAAQESQVHGAEAITPARTEQLDADLDELAQRQEELLRKLPPFQYHSKTSGRSDLPASDTSGHLRPPLQ